MLGEGSEVCLCKGEGCEGGQQQEALWYPVAPDSSSSAALVEGHRTHPYQYVG